MSRQKPFSPGTVVPSTFLNDQQQALTGATFGGSLTVHSSDTAKVSLIPAGYEVVAPIVIPSGTGAIADTYVVGYVQTAVHSLAASGGAGTRDIWVSTTTAAQASTPGIYTVSITATGDSPSDAFERRIGSAYWTGTVLSTGRMLNGVMADATQTNMFTFKSMFDSTSDIPLTLQGGAAQGAGNGTLLSVGYLEASVYSQRLSITAKGRVTSIQTLAADEHYRVFLGTDAQPILSLSSTIKMGPGGATATDTTIERSAAAVVKITNTLDVVSLQNSTGSGSLAGAVNVLDGLNVTGAISISGTALASTNLSDTAALARLAGPAFTGTPTAPTAAVDTNTTQLATTAYVVGQGYAKLVSPTFTGTPALPTGTTGVTQAAADSTTKLATTAFVTTADNLKANLASPTFTGTPTLPTGTIAVTQVVDNNTVAIATTAYVVGQGYLKSATAGSSYQPLDSDLTTIAGLAPTTDNFIVSVAGAWASRTPAQVKTTLTLTNVDNTSDVNKPVSTAQQTALDLKANLASPTFTGTPTLPTGTIATTQAAADSTTKLATTAFVTTAADLKANLASPTFTGTPTLPTGTIATTQAAADSTTKLATTAFVTTADNLKANLASPTFTGTPTLPTGTIATTQAVDTNTTTIATTAYVVGQGYLKSAAASAAYQPLDSDLTAIAGLTATTDNFMVATASAWASRTPAQAKTSLALVKGDVGLGSVDNTADTAKPVSTAQQTALNLKANLADPPFTGTVTGAASTWTGDVTARSGTAAEIALTSVGGFPTLRFGAADVDLQNSAAGILKISASDKFQQNAAPTVGDDLVNKTALDAGLTALLPPGVISTYAGVSEPAGYKWCNGQDLSRTTFAALFAAIVGNKGAVTMTLASPGVITSTAHGLVIGDPVFLTTTGALYTGLVANTIYYVMTVPSANTFTLGTTRSIVSSTGVASVTTAVNTSGSQSGVHTLYYAPYGITNGDSANFKVPSLKGRVPVGLDTMGDGADAGVFATASNILGLPLGDETHLHSVDPPSTTSGVPSGSIADVTQGGAGIRTNNTHTHDVNIAAFNSASTSGVQPSVFMNFIIKT